MRRGWKVVGYIARILNDGVMKIGGGVGATETTLRDGAAGFTVGDGDLVRSGRLVDGSSTGGGDGGRGSMEGARVYAVSVGVAIDVAKILTML